MMKYLKLLICLIVLFPICVKGAICSNSDKIRLQQLAKNITTSYDYVENNGNVVFSINFYNLNSELYLVDTKSNNKYYYTGETLNLGGYSSNTNYKFAVRSSNIMCDSSVIYYIYVATPAYNPYYNDPICEGVNYKYCNKWQRNTLSYEDFVKNVEEYKNRKSVIEVDDNVKGIFDIILEFYINNYYIILPILIVIIIVYIVINSIINRKKNNLF